MGQKKKLLGTNKLQIQEHKKDMNVGEGCIGKGEN